MILKLHSLKRQGGRTLLAFVMLFAPTLVSAVRVIEEQAIPFTAFLSKADFDQRFPGKEVEEVSILNPGWYVIYEHETLAYYFGPILLQSTGEDYLIELTETVEAAVAQRPAIENYRLVLRYEPSQSASDFEKSPRAAQNAQKPATAPPSGLWGFIRSIFGF